MRFGNWDMIDFWLMPWSQPLRDACVWIARFGAPLQGKRPNADAPRWLRPLLLQRWVAQAVTARLAWLRAHPDLVPDRYGGDSAPDWELDGWQRCERGWLRALSEAAILRLFCVEAERLVRVAEEAPALVGGAGWTCAALAASAQIAQLYAELKRRHHAMPARAMLREELRLFVEEAYPVEV